VNFCRACQQDFGSVSAFDHHRVGSHAYPRSPGHEDGRRCLDTDELKAKGWHQDKHGRWRQPITPGRLPILAPVRFTYSPGAAETGRVAHG
jgi:hypothetical protein